MLRYRINPNANHFIVYVQHNNKVNSRKYVVKRYKHIFLRPSETCVDVEKITYYCKRACSFIIDIISLYRYYLNIDSGFYFFIFLYWYKVVIWISMLNIIIIIFAYTSNMTRNSVETKDNCAIITFIAFIAFKLYDEQHTR